MHRNLGRAGTATAIASLLLLMGLALAPRAASAHALVRASVPADGALVQSAPAQVSVTFTEPPDPKLSSLRVLNADGNQVEAGPSTAVADRPLQLRIALPPGLPKGVYTVAWRAVSHTDGHVTAGSFSFGVGVTPPATGGVVTGQPTTPSPTPLAVAGRWAFLWGLVLLLGGAVGRLVWWRAQPRGGRLLLAGSWVLAAVGLVAMIWAERSAVGVPLSRLLGSATGREFVRRAGVLVLVLGAVLAAVGWPRPLAFRLLAGAVGLAMLVHVMAGHAAGGSIPAFDIAVQWLHLVAVGVWIGGLAWLLLLLGSIPREERGALVARFSTLAGIALGVVVVTGVSRALAEVGWPDHWRRLVSTSFGWALVVKLGLVALLIALGARNRYRNVRRAAVDGDSGPVTRTVRWEVVVAVLVIAATAVLSELPPSATVAAATGGRVVANQVVVSGSDFATTTRVRLTVTPGTVGPNRFTTRVTDYDTGQPVAAIRVGLTFALPGRPDLGTSTLELRQGPAGTWKGEGTELSMDGRWSVTAQIQAASGGVEVPLMVETRLPPERIDVSRVPGQPTLFTIHLAGGATLQTYIDPGTVGNNSVHFTFFTASGDELPIASATGSATPPEGGVADLPLTRFDPGHFVANTSLQAGPWRFLIAATTADGTTYHAYFEERIPAAGG